MLTPKEFTEVTEGIRKQVKSKAIKALATTFVCTVGFLVVKDSIRLFAVRRYVGVIGSFGFDISVFGVLLISITLPLLIFWRNSRRLKNGEPRLFCPHCGERMEHHLSVATRHCACCSRRILAEPEEASGPISTSMSETVYSKPGTELRKLNDLSEAVKNSGRLVLLGGGGATLILFAWIGTGIAILRWLTSREISTGRAVPQVLQTVIELTTLFPAIALFFAIIWLVDRSLNRNPLTCCPKCERQLPFLHQVIATHHCGHCGERVLPEIAEDHTDDVVLTASRLKEVSDEYRRRIQRFAAMLYACVFAVFILLTILGPRRLIGPYFQWNLSNTVVVLVAIMFCTLPIIMLWKLEKKVRREPTLRCPLCGKFLGYGRQAIGTVIASRNCLHCGRRILSEPDVDFQSS